MRLLGDLGVGFSMILLETLESELMLEKMKDMAYEGFE